MSNSFVAMSADQDFGRSNSPLVVSLVRFQEREPTQSLNFAVKLQAEDMSWSELIARRSHLTAKRTIPYQAVDAVRLSRIWGQIRDFIGDDPVVAFQASRLMVELFVALEGSSIGADIEYFDIDSISTFGLGLWPLSTSNPISFLAAPHASNTKESAEEPGVYTHRMLRLTNTPSIKQLASKIYGAHMTKKLTKHGPLHLHPLQPGAEKFDLWKRQNHVTPPTLEYHQTFGNVSDAGWSIGDIASGNLFSDVTRHLSFEGNKTGFCGVIADSSSIFRFLHEVTFVEGAHLCKDCMKLAA